MAVDMAALNPLPRSFGPSPGERRPRQQKKHGRQYSVQLDIGDKPIEHEDDGGEVEARQIPPLAPHSDNPNSSQEPDDTRSETPPRRLLSRPAHPLTIVETHDTPLQPPAANQEQTLPQASPLSGPSSEELFARRFGYGAGSPVSPKPLVPPTPPLEESFPDLRSRVRRHSYRQPARFDDGEEGNLVVLPPPLLLRPRSFWHNTRDTALHTPSYHLVRRATFLAAGLAFDSPVSDLSAFAVESRNTVGKVRGLSGSAGVPVGLGVFG